jgi:chaperonin cofactor prefoldin
MGINSILHIFNNRPADIAELKNKFDELEEKFDLVDTQTKVLKTRVESTEKKFDELKLIK